MVRFFSTHFERKDQTLRMAFWIILAVCLVLFFIPHIASAQEFVDPKGLEILQKAQHYLSLILRGLNVVFWPIILMIGGLLDNEIILGGEMGEKLREIWVNIRNLVNVVFVLILIAIALYNVLGLGEKGGPFQALQLKQAFPKFVIALIVVNFSFLGARVFLDFTNVLTKAILVLPTNIIDTTKAQGEFAEIICQEGIQQLSFLCDKKTQGELSERGKAFFSPDRSNVALAMAVTLGKLPLQNLTKPGIEGFFQLTFNLITGIILFFIYGVAFIILFAVLLVRIPVLWVLIALSPLWAVGIVLPQLGQLAGGEGGGLGKKFLQHAISPLIMALFLSVGYIMIFTLRGEPGVSNGFFSSIRLDEADPFALFSGMTTIQEFLASIAVAAVVWVGAGIAAKGTVAEKFSEGLRQYTASFGKWAAKLPLYAQVIPTTEGGPKVSLGAIKEGLHAIGDLPRTKAREEAIFKLGPKGVDYSDVKERKTPDALMQYLKAKPGILRDQHSLFEEKLETLLRDKPEVLRKFKEATNVNERVEALFSDEDVKSLLAKAGYSRPDALRDAISKIPKPETTLRLREDLSRQRPEKTAEYMDVQGKMREALDQNVEAFRQVGDKFKNISEYEYQQMKNDFDKLSGEEKKNLTFFDSSGEFNYGNSMAKLKLVLDMKTALQTPGAVYDSKLEQLAPDKELVKSVLKAAGDKNKALADEIRTQLQIPAE